MDLSRTLRLESLHGSLFTHLDSRDAAVWVREAFVAEAGAAAVAEVIRLPWRLALSESAAPDLLAALEASENADDPLVRRRGFVQIVDTIQPTFFCRRAASRFIY